MNEREKANRIARDAIVTWLVLSAQPKTDTELVELIRKWDKATYKDLIEDKEKRMARNPWTCAVLARYMEVCIQEAEKIKA